MSLKKLKKKEVKENRKYMIKIKKMLEGKAGGLHRASVFHDEWCLIWKGKGCNCEPDIFIVEEK